MSFEKEAKFGVLKIDKQRLLLYSAQNVYSVINTGFLVKDARWVGNKLVVYLLNGKVRKYQSQNTYINV